MASTKKQRRKLGRELKQARETHAELLDKVERARRKFEKRSSKLQELEAWIAQLELEYYTPESARLGQADASDKSLRHARLILNPNSGGVDDPKKIERIVGELRANGIVADIGIKTSGKAARDLAKEAADNGEELIIVAAGDGTIEEVASQLINTKTTIGIIPLGTMNNLARALGIPLKLRAACALIGMGVNRFVDIGHVLAKEKPNVEYFLESAGAGLTAIIIPAGQAAEKGRWSALPDAIRKLFDVKPGPVTVRLDDGEVIRANSQLVTVSNSPLMGKNIFVAPDAKMDDGLLDVGVYEDRSKADLLAHFLAASNGKRVADPRVKFYRARHVRIESDHPLEAHSDKDQVDPKVKRGKKAQRGNGAERGEEESLQAFGERQYVVEIEIVPGALSMIVGKGVGLTLPVQAVPAVPPLAGSSGQDDADETDEEKTQTGKSDGK